MSSKIKVDTIENVAGSGNVSLGSGHNLVVPGNITGSGNLTVDTNTLHVNASNNRVGVGTTSPNNPLEISHTGSAGAGGLRIGDPSTIASDTGIYLRTTGDAVIGAAGGDIVFDTNMAVQEDMRIDSNGRVTKPRQPAFLTYGSPTMTATSGNYGYFHSFGNTGGTAQSFNIGGHYNNTNGRFTAPVAGRYKFGLSIMRQQAYSGANQLIYIAKNSDASGGAYIGANASASQQYDQIQCHFIYNLAANDFVVGLYYVGAGSFTLEPSTPRHSFYGYLIG